MFKLNNSKINWKYILIVVFVAFLTGGGILEYYSTIKKEIKPLEVKLPEKNQGNETTNWNTYTGESFSLKYPNGWKYKISNEKQYFETDITFYKNSDALFGIGIGNYDVFLKKVSSVEEMVNSTKKWVELNGRDLKEENIIVDNISAKKLSFRLAKYYIAVFEIYLEKGGKIYTISAQASQKETYFPIFNQMLSTFKFLK